MCAPRVAWSTYEKGAHRRGVFVYLLTGPEITGTVFEFAVFLDNEEQHHHRHSSGDKYSIRKKWLNHLMDLKEDSWKPMNAANYNSEHRAVFRGLNSFERNDMMPSIVTSILSWVLTKAADRAPAWYEKYHADRTEHQDAFIIQAIDIRECLSPNNKQPGTVSFEAIYNRVGMLQVDQPEWASKAHMPTFEDPNRWQHIRDIVTRMTIAGKLRPGRCPDTWYIPLKGMAHTG